MKEVYEQVIRTVMSHGFNAAVEYLHNLGFEDPKDQVRAALNIFNGNFLEH